MRLALVYALFLVAASGCDCSKSTRPRSLCYEQWGSTKVAVPCPTPSPSPDCGGRS